MTAISAPDTGSPVSPGLDRRSESGYVLPMTALLLVPLMIFAALVVDIGAWYVRADQAQRTADAAALAGTVWLPDDVLAVQVAQDVAARNGFRDPAWVALNGGTANATVTSPGLTASGGLQIDVSVDSPSYFGAVVLDSVAITRTSVAAVTPSVRMGNPTNALGTGNLDSSELGTTPDGIWLSLNGWCQDHQQGDPFSVGRYGAESVGGSRTDTCNTASLGPNPTLNPEGYTFIVDNPSGASAIHLEVFEPGLCSDSDTSDLLYSTDDQNYGNGPRLNFRVLANDDTPHFHSDNLAQSPVVEILYEIDDCTGGIGAGGRWYPLYTIPASEDSVGLWYIQANVRQDPDEGSFNSFSLRARPAGTSFLCSSMVTPTCPEIYAKDWLTLFRPNFNNAVQGQPAEFFLAEVTPQHAGKQLEVTMFDPGEGMHDIQFLDPAGNSVAFDNKLVNCSVGLICTDPTRWPETTLSASDFCDGDPCLDVTNARFQDQWIQLVVDLPPTYSCSTHCWWKVRYTPETGVPVTDRTTWGVRIVGGPVRLVE